MFFKQIYIAHKISGASGDEVFDWFDKTRDDLEYLGYGVLSPMSNKGEFRNELKYRAEGYDDPVVQNHAIFERDRWMVTQADMLLMDLTGTTQPSIGCMMELAWASMLGKHTIIVLPKDNTHRHAFVLEAGDIIFETYPEAIDYLTRLSGGEDD